jgi:hypothetical protein
LRTEFRRIFGPEREEDRSWREVHNDELHGLYSSPNIVRAIKLRRMRWMVYVAHMGEGRGVYRFYVGRPEGKGPLGRPRCRWEDNIKMNLREIRIEGTNWIQSSGEFCEHGNEPLGSIKKVGYCLTS